MEIRGAKTHNLMQHSKQLHRHTASSPTPQGVEAYCDLEKYAYLLISVRVETRPVSNFGITMAPTGTNGHSALACD